MKKNVKRYLSLVLALCMLAICVPMSTMATDSNVIVDYPLTQNQIIGTSGEINTAYIWAWDMELPEWSADEQAALVTPKKTETADWGYLILKDGSSWVEINFTQGEEYVFELDIKPVEKTEFYLAQGNSKLDGTIKEFAPTGDWQKYTCSFTPIVNGNIAIYLEGGSSYIKNLKISKKINPELVSSTPVNGSNVIPTNEASLTFNVPMGESALNVANYKITGGTTALAVQSVATTDSLNYTLTFSGATENKQAYTVSYNNLLTADGENMPDGMFTFISGGTKIVDYPLDQSQMGTSGYVNTANIYAPTLTTTWDSTEGAAIIDSSSATNTYDSGIQIRKSDGTWDFVKLTEGNTYMLEIDVKPCVEKEMNVSIMVGNNLLEHNVTFTENRWQKYSYTFTSPQTIGVAVRLRGMAYVRNLKLYEAYEQPATFELVSSTPADGGKMGIKKFVDVEFNTPLSSASLNAESFKLSGGTQTIKAVEGLGNNKYRVIFDKMLTEKTVYSLDMNVTDFFGRTLDENITFATPVEIVMSNTFSTKAERDMYWQMFSTEMGFKVWGGTNEDADGNTQEGIVTSARLYKNEAGSADYSIIHHGQPNTAGGVDAIQFEKGKTYTISMDMKGIKDFSLEMYLDGWRKLNNTFEVKKNEWNTYSFTFTPTVTARVGYNVAAEVGDSIYVDNIYITKEVQDDLYFNDTKFYLDYGTDAKHEISETVEEGKITAFVDGIMNYSSENANLLLVIAYYENDALKVISSDSMTIEPDKISAEALTASVEVPEKTEGVTRKVKAFLWNGDTLAPIGAVGILGDF